MTQRILIADDEPLYLRTTGDLLRRAGYECICVPDADTAIEKLHRESFDLVLSDLNMPGNIKLELLHELSTKPKPPPIIVITGVPSLPSAIESIRLGITDYLLKPVKFEDLLATVRRVLSRTENAAPTTHALPKTQYERVGLFPGMIGKSQPMLELFEIVDRIASTDTNILITGESGTGKEVIAKTIHQHSHRSKGMFQVIDCTAVPEALFESMLFGHKKGAFTSAVNDQPGLLKQCDRGTAFFDELGELPLPLQAKLLRAVQEQTFTPVGSHSPVTIDTRFICATNRNLQLEVNAGRFRQDLFYRLGVIHIELPPLRERGEDVIELAEHFLKVLLPKSSAVEGFTPAAIDAFLRYNWPGNIRELRNVIERTIALARGRLIDRSDLPNVFEKTSQPGPGTDADTGRSHAFAPSAGLIPPVNQVPGSNDHASGQMGPGDQTGPPPANLMGTPVVPPVSREEALKIAEYQYLVGLLAQHAGNVSEAARQAGMSRQGLHKLLKTHDLSAADYR